MSRESQPLVATSSSVDTQTAEQQGKRSHVFSAADRATLLTVLPVFLGSAIFLHQVFLMFFSGKPKFEATGAAVADYCTQGLNDKIIDVCSWLQENQTALFDMNQNTQQVPSLFPPVIQQIPGWFPFNNKAWINYFTCSLQNTVMTFEGHSYIDSVKNTLKKTVNGFPVTTIPVPMDNDPLTCFIEMNIATMLFLAGFCIRVQNGGYAQNGHFDGYEEAGKQFETNAYIFSMAMAVIAFVSGLTVIKFAAEKALSTGLPTLSWFKRREGSAPSKESTNAYSAA